LRRYMIGGLTTEVMARRRSTMSWTSSTLRSPPAKRETSGPRSAVGALAFCRFALCVSVPAVLTPLRLFSRTPVKATARAAIPTYQSLVIAEQSRLPAVDLVRGHAPCPGRTAQVVACTVVSTPIVTVSDEH
jgi:hypothetical protein